MKVSRKRKVSRINGEIDKRVREMLGEEYLSQFGYDLVILVGVAGADDTEDFLYLASNFAEGDMDSVKKMLKTAQKKF